MMDAIEEFLAKGLPGVKVSLGKGKVVAKSEFTSTTKASVDRNWVADPLLPDGWKVAIVFDDFDFYLVTPFAQVCLTDDRTWRPIRIFLSEKDNKNFPGIAGVLRCGRSPNIVLEF